MTYLLATITHGIRIVTGFDSELLVSRAANRALAMGATCAKFKEVADGPA